MGSSSRESDGEGGAAAIGLSAPLATLAFSVGGAMAAPGPTDLQLTESDGPDPVLEKGTLVYTIQIRNLGSGGTADATSVVVTDTLPGSVTFFSATLNPTTGSCSRAGVTVTCELGDLAEGGVATVTIVVKAGKKGTISNTAAVTTTVVDTDPPKNKKKKLSCAAPTIVGTAGNDVIRGTRGRPGQAARPARQRRPVRRPRPRQLQGRQGPRPVAQLRPQAPLSAASPGATRRRAGARW